MNYKLLFIFLTLLCIFLTKDLLAINEKSLAILPDELQLQITSNSSKEVLLIWNYKNIHQVKKFAVEHSTDGITFTTIGEISCVQDSFQFNTYEFKDANPSSSISYYRLLLMDENSMQLAKTPIQSIAVIEEITLNLFPNPAQDMLQVRAVGEINERYEVHIYNPMGYLVRHSQVQSTGGIYTKYIDIKDLSAGVYIVKILRDNFSVKTSVL